MQSGPEKKTKISESSTYSLCWGSRALSVLLWESLFTEPRRRTRSTHQLTRSTYSTFQELFSLTEEGTKLWLFSELTANKIHEENLLTPPCCSYTSSAASSDFYHSSCFFLVVSLLVLASSNEIGYKWIMLHSPGPEWCLPSPSPGNTHPHPGAPLGPRCWSLAWMEPVLQPLSNYKHQN